MRNKQHQKAVQILGQWFTHHPSDMGIASRQNQMSDFLRVCTFNETRTGGRIDALGPLGPRNTHRLWMKMGYCQI